MREQRDGVGRRAARALVEGLEDRRLLSAGNVLLSGSGQNNSHVIREYTQAGALVRTIDVPNSPAGYDQIRDLVVDAAGNIDLWQGTFNPYLGTFDGTGWTYRTAPQWNTYGVTTYGQLAAFGNYVYAEDRDYGGPARGIVRWDLSTTAPGVRTTIDYAPGFSPEPSDVTMGMDGFLYAHANGTAIGFDPVTMAVVKFVKLPPGLEGDRLVVDRDGNLYVNGGGYLTKLSPAGKLLKQVVLRCDEMDVSDDGKIVIALGDKFVIADTGLNVLNVVQAQGGYWGPVFVSWGSYQTPRSPAPAVTPPGVTIDPVGGPVLSAPLDAVTFRFSEPVTGFDVTDLTLSSAWGAGTPGGTLTAIDDRTFVLTGMGPSNAAELTYTLTFNAVRSDVYDDYGFNPTTNPSISWTYTKPAPVPPTATIAAVVPARRSTAVPSVSIAFSAAVRGFNLADLKLTRDGAAVSLTGATLTTADGGQTYTLAGLAAKTAASGSYQLKLTAAGSGVADASTGAALEADAATAWVTDAPPTVSFPSAVAAQAASPYFDVDVAFSEPVTGFDLSDLTLTRDGVAVPLDLAALVPTDDRAYRLTSLPAVAGVDGAYVLSFNAATDVVDAAGQPVVGTPSVAWTLLLPPRVTSLLPNTPPPATGAYAFYGSQLPIDLAVTGTGLSRVTAITLERNPGVFYPVQVVSRTDTSMLLRADPGTTPGDLVVRMTTARAGDLAMASFSLNAPVAPVATAVVDPSDPTAFKLAVNGFEQSAATYTWSVTSSDPEAAVAFGPQGSPQASAVVDRAGTYSFSVTASVGGRSVVVAAGPVAMPRVLTALPRPWDWAEAVVPNYLSIPLEEKGYDQFGRLMTVAPEWSLAPGSLGSIAQAGGAYVYKAPASGLGTATVVGTTGAFTSRRTVVVGPTSDRTIKVDFAPAAAASDAESLQYDRDAGGVYGARGTHVYGWSVDQASAVVDRNKNARQLVDTSVAVKAGARWEYAVPNGTWTVTVGVGDSGAASTNTVRVEGVTACSGLALAANAFATRTVTVTVKDNRLTVDAGSAANLATRLTHVTAALAAEVPTAVPLTLGQTFDFSPAASPYPGGTIKDWGMAYADTSVPRVLRYGWSTSHAGTTYDRGAVADDVADTVVAVRAGTRWELLVPNGSYTVTVGLGDPAAASTNTVTLEGVTLAAAVPLAAGELTTRTATVVVTDGKLTLGVGSAADLATRLTFLQVARATLTPATKVNFQPAASTPVSGYLADAGGTFAARNGRTYGWTVSHADTVVDRNRNANQLLDTSVAVKAGARWELAVVNGTYTVKVGVGDAGAASTNTVTVEGKGLYAAQPLAANVFGSKTITVTVTDGRLTLGVGAAANLATRLTFVEVAPA